MRVPGAVTLRVLTETGVAVEDEATSIIAPGEVGYLGMLRNHAPLVTTLQSGKLIWTRASGERRTLRVGTGLLEIAKNRCTLLTSTVSDASPSPTHAV